MPSDTSSVSPIPNASRQASNVSVSEPPRHSGAAPRFINALKLGLLFGVIEGITPVIGWLIGSAGAEYIEQYDHWIAFGLLVLLGAHMIYASFNGDEEEESVDISFGSL